MGPEIVLIAEPLLQECIPAEISVPLCVDLDGSLIRSDSLAEGFILALRTHPLACLKACLLLAVSRAKFKHRIAELAPLDPRFLPYRSELLRVLDNEAAAGRPLILTTAADGLVAQSVARHLGIFDGVIASDGVVNRKGKQKLIAIKQACGRFLYAGDSAADVPIWKESEGAIVLGGNPEVLRAIRQSGVPVHRAFESRVRLRTVLRAIRVHQWAKNLLVLVPIFLGHRVTDSGVWAPALLTMAVFCRAASLAYVVNDLADLEADRQHPLKRKRPFASADLSPTAGFAMVGALAAAVVVLTVFLPPAARLWIGIYFVATLSYSMWLKKMLLVDVVELAILYSIRVMAGGAATNITISPWTLAFCLFVFYSLALGKRFGELHALPQEGMAPPRRGYEQADLPVLAATGVASGVLSVVVFALYISSPEVKVHYAAPRWLWLGCPVILYWFCRFWILANRGTITEDPIVFTFKDKISYLVAVCIGLVWLAASVWR